MITATVSEAAVFNGIVNGSFAVCQEQFQRQVEVRVRKTRPCDIAFEGGIQKRQSNISMENASMFLVVGTR